MPKSYFLTCGFLFPVSTVNIITGLRSFLLWYSRGKVTFAGHMCCPQFLGVYYFFPIILVGLHFCGHHYFFWCLRFGGFLLFLSDLPFWDSFIIGKSSVVRSKQCKAASNQVIQVHTGPNRVIRGQTRQNVTKCGQMGLKGAKQGQTGPNGAKRGQTKPNWAK